MSQILLSDREWPILRVTWPARHTMSDVELFIKELERQVDRCEPFAMVMDMSQASVPTSEERDYMNRALERRRDDMRRYCKAQGFFVTSWAIRLFINKASALIKPPQPMNAFATLAEAERFCLDRLHPTQIKTTR